MGRDQILRLLGEREAAGRAEVVRLGQEAARIGGLIEECRRELDRLTTAREVLSGLVEERPGAVAAGQDLKPDAVLTHQLLEVLAEAGRPCGAGTWSRRWARIRRWPGIPNGSGTG